MQFVIDVPDDKVKVVHQTPAELSRQLLEAFVVESYRRGSLSDFQVQHLLGFHHRLEVDAWLQQQGVMREYTAEEFERDYQNSRMASEEFRRSER